MAETGIIFTKKKTENREKNTEKLLHQSTYFNKNYVQPEIFPRELGRKIVKAEEIRHASDYDDFYIASKEESERQIAVAEEFIKLSEHYCLNELK